MPEELLTAQMKEDLRKSFKLLKEDITLEVFTRKGVNDPYNDVLLRLVRELETLEPRIKASFHEVGGEESTKYGVERSPTLLISPERYRIRFTGAPLGEEGRALVMAIIMASAGASGISEESRKRLGNLKEKRHVRVFTSPT